MKLSKRLFNKVMQLSLDYQSAKLEFDSKVEEIYGMHYSDVDDDWLIDALNYGQHEITYETFCEKMEEHKKENKDSHKDVG